MSTADSTRQKAFDFAQQATKQLITLATGIIALTITFLTDVVDEIDGVAMWFLRASWISYLLSVVAGFMTLLTLAGQLERPGDEGPSIYAKPITIFSVSQVVTFLVALTLTLAFGFLSV